MEATMSSLLYITPPRKRNGQSPEEKNKIRSGMQGEEHKRSIKGKNPSDRRHEGEEKKDGGEGKKGTSTEYGVREGVHRGDYE